VRRRQKILLAGRMKGWQGVHWTQLAAAFRKLGHECATHHYSAVDRPRLLAKLTPGDSEARLVSRRTGSLMKALRAQEAEVLILHSLRFDMDRLRDGFRGRILLWDWDGPAGALGKQGDAPTEGLDLVATVSRPTLRELERRPGPPAFYLPHGVDTESFAPGPVSEDERRRFASQLAFVGRPTPRRIELLEAVADRDLVVWGRRWHDRIPSTSPLVQRAREAVDIEGADVVALYRSADALLDISREPFVDPPTTLSLQVFQVPSCGGCLISERVEELEESFDPGSEILAFRGAEELTELCDRLAAEPETGRRIGVAGRRRCEADHTLLQRAGQLIEWLEGVGA